MHEHQLLDDEDFLVPTWREYSTMHLHCYMRIFNEVREGLDVVCWLDQGVKLSASHVSSIFHVPPLDPQITWEACPVKYVSAVFQYLNPRNRPVVPWGEYFHCFLDQHNEK